MLHYIIDGNNLIGKIKSFSSLQKKDKQSAREKLTFYLERYFSSKKTKVTLHFDGYENLPIKTQKIIIVYSENKTADEIIKRQIEDSRNPKNLVVVSSDNGVIKFAKVCSCEIIQSENFAKMISRKTVNEEEEIKKSISDDEVKKLFGL